MKNYINAFTLVELVIVTTILTILRTISFISYNWQIESSKNTVRITDLSNLWASLKNHKLRLWAYPIPWDYFNIVYSWASNIVAKQWYMNDKVYSTEITKKPTDPDKENSYIFSVNWNRNFYNLATIIFPENDTEKEKAYLVWDYQTIAKTILPTLILATSTWAGNNIEIWSWISDWTTNRLKFIVNNGTLNLPYNSQQITPISTATSFDSIFTESGIIYSQFPWYSSCIEIYESWKSIWSWSYQILSSTGIVTNTGCSMNY